jgi:C4-dicarboxylate transporter DctM subunit
MLAGRMMERGGISRRLVKLANECLGAIKGGLAMTTVLACAFFAALSGSSPGTVAAIGSIMYPEMRKKNYDEGFAAGLISCAGGIGPIIPPSILMVTFGVTTETSISSLFLGGILPGIFMTGALIIVAYIISCKQGYGGDVVKRSIKSILKAFIDALPALGMPLLILGGIYGGVFTPTEAAAVAVFYALLVGVFIYRELSVKDIINTLESAAVSSAVVMLVIATSTPFSWIFARQGLASVITNYMLGFLNTPFIFLLVTTIILLIFGTFMEGNAIILLLMPFLFPISQSLGVDPIHFGLISTVALVVGCTSPPVAVNIYTAVGVTGVSMERIIRGMLPFFITMIIVTFILIFIPGLTTFLPQILN